MNGNTDFEQVVSEALPGPEHAVREYSATASLRLVGTVPKLVLNREFKRQVLAHRPNACFAQLLYHPSGLLLLTFFEEKEPGAVKVVGMKARASGNPTISLKSHLHTWGLAVEDVAGRYAVQLEDCGRHGQNWVLNLNDPL